MNFKKRLGNFLTTVGAVLLIMFFLSDYIQQVEGWYLLFGIAILAIGITLALQGREKRKPSGRFRLLRGGRGQEKDSEDEDKDDKES